MIADSLGFFRKAGLDVRLSYEAGWATIRDKLAFGELDVVQALSPFPFAMRHGIGITPTDVVTGMVLSSNGNAITLSKSLWKEGVEDGDSLARAIGNGLRPRKLVLGVVSLHSSHHFMLCRWLEQYGIDPKKDVIVIVLPLEQMVRNLAAGHIDGFSVGEPWNSIAVEAGSGWCAATGNEIFKAYPEKVLATTEGFLADHRNEYLGLVRVLREACSFCDQAENRPRLLEILSSRQCLDSSPDILSKAFSGSFPTEEGRRAEGTGIRFSGAEVNRPDVLRAEAVWKDFCQYASVDLGSQAAVQTVATVYREDLYNEAFSGA